jgi:hypothetical protein
MSSTRASVLIINQKQDIKHIDNETIEKKVEDFDFNSMLVDISKLLNDNDLKQMKFMCTDIIKRRDMEKVKTPLDFKVP